jgi:hypothetical protein
MYFLLVMQITMWVDILDPGVLATGLRFLPRGLGFKSKGHNFLELQERRTGGEEPEFFVPTIAPCLD